jgi:uncharacterized protein YeaO (DUF488 family)
MPDPESPHIRLRRAYDPPSASDGYRVLVDRVWPRGISRDALRLDEWLKEVAPSTELRKWFGHDPEKWTAFKDRYFLELEKQSEAINRLLAKCREGPLTLVFGAKDTRYNNAAALKEYLEQRAGR